MNQSQNTFFDAVLIPTSDGEAEGAVYPFACQKSFLFR